MKIETKKFIYASVFPIIFVILLWIIKILEWSLNANWSDLGVFPLEFKGLIGIFTSPLIHADWMHLFSNSIPLLILGWCLCYFYSDISYKVFLLIWILSGMILWLIGRDSWHIGASSLVYGLSFFLFFSGIFRQHTPLIAISLLVAFLYGSTVWNMFPVSELIVKDVSWEGHLSGAISGSICSIIFRKYGPQKPEPEEENPEDDNEDDNEILLHRF